MEKSGRSSMNSMMRALPVSDISRTLMWRILSVAAIALPIVVMLPGVVG
jgi:hypothetical protein